MDSKLENKVTTISEKDKEDHISKMNSEGWKIVGFAVQSGISMWDRYIFAWEKR